MYRIDTATLVFLIKHLLQFTIEGKTTQIAKIFKKKQILSMNQIGGQNSCHDM